MQPAALPRSPMDPMASKDTPIAFSANSRSPLVTHIPGPHVTRHDIAALAQNNTVGASAITQEKGQNNQLFLGRDVELSRLAIDVRGKNNRIYIGSGARLRGTVEVKGNDCIVFIGARTTFQGVKLFCRAPGHVFIGKDCMFSSGIEIRTSDSHSVIDLDTMTLRNPVEGVHIGDHVWIGKGTTVQRGACIAEDSIIGLGSFVRGAFPEPNCVIAGTPARVVGTRRSWSRQEGLDPQEADIYAWRALDLL